jgi:hypothetical protein
MLKENRKKQKRQTDKTERQADRWIERWTDGKDRKTNRRMDIEMDR